LRAQRQQLRRHRTAQVVVELRGYSLRQQPGAGLGLQGLQVVAPGHVDDLVRQDAGVFMDLGIAGKWALVCGASKGLGFGCAQALVREGVNVVINARNADALQVAASQLIAAGADAASARGQNGTKPVVLTVAADITTPEGRAAVFAVPGGPGRDFDIVVTNAGGPPTGDFRDWDRDAWIKAVDANMLTPIELIKATVDGMAARGFGRVVNITSSAVKAPIDILGLSNGARSGLISAGKFDTTMGAAAHDQAQNAHLRVVAHAGYMRCLAQALQRRPTAAATQTAA
jgi:NAD(P)-dependent dehydrogenase (short-subunit alcohol dehydrogenase family)